MTVVLWMIQVLDTRQREAEQRQLQAAEQAAANTNSNATVNGANEAQDEVDSRDDQKSKVSYVECFYDVSRFYLAFNCSWLIFYIKQYSSLFVCEPISPYSLNWMFDMVSPSCIVFKFCPELYWEVIIFKCIYQCVVYIYIRTCRQTSIYACMQTHAYIPTLCTASSYKSVFNSWSGLCYIPIGIRSISQWRSAICLTFNSWSGLCYIPIGIRSISQWRSAICLTFNSWSGLCYIPIGIRSISQWRSAICLTFNSWSGLCYIPIGIRSISQWRSAICLTFNSWFGLCYIPIGIRSISQRRSAICLTF